MQESLDPIARAALEASLKEKVKRLLADQVALGEQRAALLTQQRRNDRDLADCRSTARLFDIEIDIPMPDRELQIRERELEMSERARLEAATMQRRLREAELRHRAEVEVRVRGAAPREYVHTPIPAARSTLEDAAAAQVVPGPSQLSSVPIPLPPTKRPSLKDFLIQRLTEAGATGAKAAPLREMFERAYGETIHEKTVGMTLYRMSKDNLVTREGHTWFIATVPQGAETVNPGADTPGSENRLI